MQTKKYNEFKVVGHLQKGKFVIDSKQPTKRGSVMINEKEAAINNSQTRFNKLHYELAEEKKAGRPKKED